MESEWERHFFCGASMEEAVNEPSGIYMEQGGWRIEGLGACSNGMESALWEHS